ncbi:MAG: hypothetical protein WC356_06925 [Candidatus Micrarchaeia archaeon]|jgi:mRNA-degrading endonuclease RelE of RelBE toxin-antitoxin system
MAFIEKLVDILHKFNLGICFLLMVISLIYINDVNTGPIDLTSLNLLLGSLLTFVGIFYGIVILNQVSESLRKLNEKDTKELKKRIHELKKKEESNIENKKYLENIDICENKIAYYQEIASIKDRNIHNILFISTLLIILLLIINSVPINLEGDYLLLKNIIFIGLFWSFIYYLNSLIVLFYKSNKIKSHIKYI